MGIPYFPGCTLHVKAKELDDSTRAALAALGVELAELPEWTCCGTVFPLAQNNYMGMVASARILSNAAKQGDGRLVTVCSFCYHVLKRVNFAIKNNDEARTKLKEYLEEDYDGGLSLLHPLELLRDEVGFDALRNRVGERLKGVKVACYYGCMLSRPAREMDFGAPENPTIMEEFVEALGAEPVDFPGKTKCCGSYQVLNEHELVAGRVKDIFKAASLCGSQVIITSCPLCRFNLDTFGEAENRSKIPVLYFTQLLGIALEIPIDRLGLAGQDGDPKPLLREA
ncbi:CoB--CoM heterodisulfide reductase iron-sulfur subunit B family protein [Candidatus Desulforudis audaxviator]|uniref:CoB--CoM heterodisulfide reductase n=1 Tax=Desulforudis audaxviator (strain MP104C) TaxID=477974 RepID=B1I423_DESAP|nr:CoB--CoM heterodisulfide reductase iron-sulfur subunit B family protein [Candidatus Desulforudis audaxviator]ACA59762.1 CoB--CoM heterodisulfide reductase [Candidatus Desulforudis audaxviator MP104C]AZK59761.1 CoB--CoM heterodisulfide reductase subunit B [Candidatus Desulforudis audaxviator]